jgi:hypothetical protein
MKKMTGWILACLLVSAVGASAMECGGTAAAAPAAPAVSAPAAAPAVVPAATPEAQPLTIKGKVSVVKGPDGALQAIYLNPAEGHGYKVDIVNGTGKTLADKAGQTVEATGVDVNRLFNIQTITVVP